MEFTTGSPIWMDLATSDLKGATAFYGDLFGWHFEDSGEEFGNYHMATLGGDMVAGIGPKFMPEAPDAWLLYFKTTDIDATVAKVKAAGGAVVAEPMVIGESGRMAVCNDGTAFFGLWEPNQHQGFGRIGLGTMVWCELSTSSPATGQDFYSQVLGFSYLEGEAPMTMFATPDAEEGTFSGGIFDHTGKVPEGTPNHWSMYIQCEDIHGIVAKTQAAGGTVLVEPMTIEYGTLAVLQDPWGAVFCSIAMNPDMPTS